MLILSDGACWRGRTLVVGKEPNTRNLTRACKNYRAVEDAKDQKEDIRKLHIKFNACNAMRARAASK